MWHHIQSLSTPWSCACLEVSVASCLSGLKQVAVWPKMWVCSGVWLPMSNYLLSQKCVHWKSITAAMVMMLFVSLFTLLSEQIIDKLFTPVPSKHCPSCKSCLGRLWGPLCTALSPEARVALISLPLQLYNCCRFSERERDCHALVQRQLLTVYRVLVNQWSLIQCTGFCSFCMFIILYHIV